MADKNIKFSATITYKFKTRKFNVPSRARIIRNNIKLADKVALLTDVVDALKEENNELKKIIEKQNNIMSQKDDTIKDLSKDIRELNEEIDFLNYNKSNDEPFFCL